MNFINDNNLTNDYIQSMINILIVFYFSNPCLFVLMNLKKLVYFMND